MRHLNSGRKFSRHSSHRVAMFRNMANAVIMQEQIQTTTPKAKELRGIVDRLISIAKRGAPHSKRILFDRTRDWGVVTKISNDLAKRYEKREGGYTRLLKMADRRRGDGAEVSILELVDHDVVAQKKKADGKKTAVEKPAKEAGTADPFKGFRKLFGGSKKKNKELKVSAAAESVSAEASEEKKKKAPKKSSKKSKA